MQVTNLVQEGCKLQAVFNVNARQNIYETFNSPLYKINNYVTFGVYVISSLQSNSSYLYINMNFTKLSRDDSKFILIFSSKRLNIINKSLKNDDGTCYLISTLPNTLNCSFDVTVVVENVSDNKNSFASLYDDDVLTDFELRGEKGSIKVHKAVLAVSSPVLRRELEGDWRETNEGFVTILDTPKTTLQHFKDYLYLNKLPDTDVELLLLLASYYMMPELRKSVWTN